MEARAASRSATGRHALRPSTLTGRIAGTAAVLTLAFILTIATVSFFLTRAQITEGIRRSLDSEALLHAEHVGADLRSIVTTLSPLKENALVLNALMDSLTRQTSLVPFLDDFETINYIPVGVAVTDFEGNPIAGRFDVELDSADWRGPVLSEGRTFVTIRSNGSGDTLFVAEPVFWTGTLSPEGALVYHVGLADVLAPTTGLELIHTGSEPRLAGKTAFWPAEEASGDLLQTRRVPVPDALAGLDLTIKVSAESELLHRPLRNLWGWYLALAALTIGAVLVLSRVAARLLTRPLRELEQGASAVVTSGSFDHRFEVEGTDEISHLASSMNQMLARLKEAYHDLAGNAAALQASESRYRSIFNSTTAAIFEEDVTELRAAVDDARSRGVVEPREWLASSPGTIDRARRLIQLVDVNAAALRLVGARDKAELSERYAHLYSPESRDVFEQELIAFASDQSPFAAETEILTLGGERRKVLLSVQLPPTTGERSLRLVSMVDITARAQAEEEKRTLDAKMQHAQKLESLGVLAGGIAHDFNNLLMVILGSADLALSNLPASSPGIEQVQRIETAARRAAALTNQMLAYSGRGSFVVRPTQLNEVVEELGHLLTTVISKKARLQYELDPALPAIQADPAQIRQVVMNLLTNASEAIGDKVGTIVLRTRVRTVARAELVGSFVGDELAQGRYVVLEVTDSGCGMDDQTVARMFDPFFTSKFTGRGLGLAAVLGIVRGHAGVVQVASRPSRGTTFTVLFPAVDAQIDDPPPAPCPVPGQSRTVLIVDDDPGIRQIAGDMLRARGYQVLVAEDGQEGVEVFRAHADAIALVLLDLTMPRMDGREALREMRKFRPEVVVLLSSGYSEQESLSSVAGDSLAGFIQKPYRVQFPPSRVEIASNCGE